LPRRWITALDLRAEHLHSCSILRSWLCRSLRDIKTSGRSHLRGILYFGTFIPLGLNNCALNNSTAGNRGFLGVLFELEQVLFAFWCIHRQHVLPSLTNLSIRLLSKTFQCFVRNFKKFSFPCAIRFSYIYIIIQVWLSVARIFLTQQKKRNNIFSISRTGFTNSLFSKQRSMRN